MSLRRGITAGGAAKETYLSVLTTNFGILVNNPWIFTLPTVVSTEFDIYVRRAANNNRMTIAGVTGNNSAIYFDNDLGQDPTVTTPRSNSLITTATGIGVGDLRGERATHIEYTHGTGGLLLLSINGVLKDTVNDGAQGSVTLTDLFTSNNITNSQINPNILIRNLIISSSLGTSVNMILDGNFTNTGASTLGAISGVEGVDYEFVEA